MPKTNGKQKGKAGELEFSNLCKKHGYDTRRSQQYAGINNDADVVGIDGLHLEVKRTEAFRLYPSLKQAMDDKRDDEIPVVAHRKNREGWVVVLKADDFLKLYKGVGKCDGLCSCEK